MQTKPTSKRLLAFMMHAYLVDAGLRSTSRGGKKRVYDGLGGRDGRCAATP